MICFVAAVESSSGADSSEWEKEFDLDMTEDEIIEALQEEDNEVIFFIICFVANTQIQTVNKIDLFEHL